MIITIFFIALNSCNKIEKQTNVKENKNYFGIHSKQEFFDLVKTGVPPLNKLSKEEVNQFGNALIFNDEGTIIGSSNKAIDKLNEEEYNDFMKIVFKVNAFAYKEKIYATQKTNTFYDPIYGTIGQWYLNASPKGVKYSCEFSLHDNCWGPIISSPIQLNN